MSYEPQNYGHRNDGYDDAHVQRHVQALLRLEI